MSLSILIWFLANFGQVHTYSGLKKFVGSLIDLNKNMVRLHLNYQLALNNLVIDCIK